MRLDVSASHSAWFTPESFGVNHASAGKELIGMNTVRRAILFLGILGSAICGCRSEIQHEHARVHGKVTYQGKPVTFGSVLFMPVETPKEGLMESASGSINPDGTYELASQATPGAILGEHKVLVIAVAGPDQAQRADASKSDGPAPVAPKGSKELQLKSAVPKKYADPSTTTLTRKVVQGENNFDLELTN
jgi:hypothetical protein